MICCAKNFSAKTARIIESKAAATIAEAITASAGNTTPIEMMLKKGDRFRTIRFDYHGGLRYPRLERIEGTPDRLGDILTPRRR